jgi:hypothetical protein
MPARAKVETPRAEKSYWTVKEAARYLSVNYITFYSWITVQHKKRHVKLLGNPPPVRRFGRNCIRIPIDEFKEWAENFQQE